MTAHTRTRSPFGCCVLLAALALVSCGGTTDRTGEVAKCLQSALVQRAIGGNNCADTTAVKIAGGEAPKVTCTHDNGNDYVCHALAGDPGLDYLHIGDHFYTVIYDGNSMTWRPR